MHHLGSCHRRQRSHGLTPPGRCPQEERCAAASLALQQENWSSSATAPDVPTVPPSRRRSLSLVEQNQSLLCLAAAVLVTCRKAWVSMWFEKIPDCPNSCAEATCHLRLSISFDPLETGDKTAFRLSPWSMWVLFGPLETWIRQHSACHLGPYEAWLINPRLPRFSARKFWCKIATYWQIYQPWAGFFGFIEFQFDVVANYHNVGQLLLLRWRKRRICLLERVADRIDRLLQREYCFATTRRRIWRRKFSWTSILLTSESARCIESLLWTQSLVSQRLFSFKL